MHYPVMTEKHVADRWQVSLKTLRRWRLDGEGPVRHKLFRHVRYHEVRQTEKTARREAEKVQELAQSWRCRARGNGPEPRQHWHSGQKKSQPIRVGISNYGAGVYRTVRPNPHRCLLYVVSNGSVTPKVTPKLGLLLPMLALLQALASRPS